MILNFEEFQNTRLPHFKGGEGYMDARMHQDRDNKILMATLVPGCTVGLHTHVESSEILYILSGFGRHMVDGVEEVLHPGTCGYCPKGSTHELHVLGNDPLVFLAIVPEHKNPVQI